MNKRLPWFLVAALLTLGLIVKDIPASLAVQKLSAQVKGLHISGVAGTFWRGRAGSASLQWQGNVYALGELRWTIDPWSIFGLQLCAEFSTDLGKQYAKGLACAQPDGQLEVSDAEFNGPAALMELWLPIKTDGSLSLQVMALSLQEEKITSLQANASWREARFHNSHDWLDLGDFASRLSSDGAGGVKADIFDLRGPVKVDLRVKMPASAAFNVKGGIALEDAAPKELGQLFTALGFPQKLGQYQVDWTDG